MMYFNNNYQPNNRNAINWVQGIEGAKAYQLMPNSNTMLLDSENEGIFYIKTCDNVGMCNLRTFKYEEISNQFKKNDVDLTQYVTRDELKEILGEFKNEQPISAIKQPTAATASTISGSGYKLSEHSYPTGFAGSQGK